MTVSAAERRYLLTELTNLATTDLNNLWAQAARLSDVDFAQYVIKAYPLLIDPYIELAGGLAANWFEESDSASQYVAVTAALPPTAQLEASAGWALKAFGDQGKANLEGSLNRAVFDGARETTRVNVESTDSRWAVDARPTACPWCRMMATRGAVYHTKAGALKACHDNGHCIAIEDRTGDYEPPSHIEKWNDEYRKARANAGSGDPKAIQAAWRQLVATESA